MSRRPVARRLVALALLAGPVAALAAVEAGRPVYRERLDMPSGGDTLGSSDAVAADPVTGEIFVCDARNNRIVIFDENGSFRHEIRGGRTFGSPRSLAVDPEGYLFVLADYERHPALLALDFDGAFRHEVVLSGLPEDASPPDLSSLAISPDGARLFLLDVANLRVWLAGRDGAVTGSIDLGEKLESDDERRDFFLGNVDVSGGTVSVAVPAKGQIWRYDLDGNLKGRLGSKGTSRCQLAFPVAAAEDASGHVLVLDQQKMMLTVWAPSGNRCLDQYYGIGAAPGFLYFPQDLALDRQGRAYVSQGFEGRVQVYDGMAPAPGAGPQAP